MYCVQIVKEHAEKSNSENLIRFRVWQTDNYAKSGVSSQHLYVPIIDETFI